MNPIILALDMPNLSDALDMVQKTRDHIGMVKIGPELWVNHGKESLSIGSQFNIPMFLDLKLCDIPNTVSRTVEAIVNLTSPSCEIDFLTVHAMGGLEMLEAAVKATDGCRTKIAAVTLLTSLDKNDMNNFGMRGAPGTRTVGLARLARHAGVNHFVCSAQNLENMKEEMSTMTGPNGYSRVPSNYKPTIICPGIRKTNAEEDDQKRTQTVSHAIRKGADWLVIGRPITMSHDPASAARDILAQVEKARV